MEGRSSLRNIIAGETVAQKAELLRAESRAVQDLIRDLETAPDADDGNVFAKLQTRVDALLNAPLAHPGQAKEQAKKAKTFLDFVRTTADGRDPDDTSVHAPAARSWLKKLDAVIDQVRRRANYAMLFSQVLQEWIDTDGRPVQRQADPDTAGAPAAGRRGQTGEDFAPEPEVAFDVLGFLKHHGVSDRVLTAIRTSAEGTTVFGDQVLDRPVTQVEVQAAMRALAADAKAHGPDMRRQLLDESSKAIVLEELSETLTAMWRTIDVWRWPAEGVLQTYQTHLNGKQRAVLSLGIVTSIFLRIVASRWLKHLGETALAPIRRSLAKQVPVTEISSICDENETTSGDIAGMLRFADAARRSLSAAAEGEDWVEAGGHGADLEGALDRAVHAFDRGGKQRTAKAWEEQRGSLPSSLGTARLFTASAGGGDGEKEGDDYGGVFAAKAKRAASQIGDDESESFWAAGLAAQKPAIAPSTIYRLMTADIALFRATTRDAEPSEASVKRPASTACFLHADLRDFGASVPHTTTLAALKFFGLPSRWLSWFNTYLRIPLVSKVGDEAQASTRGTPFGLEVSSMVNEMLLFILDIAIYSSAHVTLRRNHDDVWMWALGTQRVTKAWAIAQHFTESTGLRWNEDKTGCTVISLDRPNTGEASAPSVASLPNKPLRWGVLFLDVTGEWKVDDAALQAQSAAARRELQTVKSYLGKINVYNRYAAFLSRNAGAPLRFAEDRFPANHRSILLAFEAQVTAERGVHAWLRDELVATSSLAGKARTDEELQEAMLYWPLRLGGFELHPQAAMILLHHRTLHSLDQDKGDSFESVLDRYTDDYYAIRDFYNSAAAVSQMGELSHEKRHDSAFDKLLKWLDAHDNELPPFMSQQTYLRHSVITQGDWCDASSNMLLIDAQKPDEVEAVLRDAFEVPLLDHFGSLHAGGALVATALVPQYAVQDVQAVTMQLFDSV